MKSVVVSQGGGWRRFVQGVFSRIATTWMFAQLVYSMTTSAATWYAAADGNSTNGTYTEPWSVEYAVGKVVGGVRNTQLKPGDTVVFKSGGTYVCTETNTVYGVGQVLEFRISGTPTAKITYRPESLWGFSFDGGLLLGSVSNLVIREFRIFYSGCTNRNRTIPSTYPGGISEYLPGNEILHNLIENTGHPGIASWKGTRGKYIAGNIVRFVGINDFTGGYNGASRGSGMYLQNAENSSEALIEGNISYFNYTTGMKAYGNTDIWGFNFRHQICAENHEAGIFYHIDNYGSQGVQATTNFLWSNGSGIRLGYPLGNGGHRNGLVVGNYVVDSTYPLYQADGWTGCTWQSNTVVKLPDQYVWYMENTGETNGDVTSHRIDYNTYYGKNYAPHHGGPFGLLGNSLTLEAWRTSVHGDTNSTFTFGTPTNIMTAVFWPSTDSNFVHVAVFNWPTNAQTTVDLGPYFAKGDTLRIFDAQEIPHAYTNFTFQGGAVPLDLTRTNIAPMLGTFPDLGTNQWKGFDPRFRAFVIYRESTAKRPPAVEGLNVIELKP